MSSFSEHLREMRCKAHLTQQQLAEHLGVDRSVYAMYENGKLDISPRLLEKICNKCAASPDVQRALAAEADE